MDTPSSSNTLLSMNLWLPLISTILMSSSLAWLAYQAVWLAICDRGDATRADVFETKRRRQLRSSSRLYLLTEPLVDEIAGSRWIGGATTLKRIEQSLLVLNSTPSWTPREWLSLLHVRLIIEFCLWLPFTIFFAGTFLGQTWLAAPLLMLLMVARREMLIRKLCRQADSVRSEILTELPFSIDLLVLMLKSGTTFHQALQTLIRQLTSAPTWSAHLGRVVEDVERGLPRLQALTQLGRRLNLDAVDQLIFAIRQGENLGTPLAEILGSQAEQIRDRHMQYLETVAEKARVRLVGPATLSMVAGFLTMLAPLLLSMGNELLQLGR